MKALIVLLPWRFRSGCAVYTPAGSVVVDPGHGDARSSNGNGKFCPPGQAKKGNC